MAVLLSPVAWIHHLHWMVVVIFAILGADPLRDRRRLVAAGILTAWFLCRLPWWGISWLNHPEWPELPGRVLQNADTFGALLALALLAWSLSRTIPLRAHPHHHPHPDPGPRPEPGPHSGPHSGPRPDRNPHSAAS
jgi:alpha-1,2-mannosyltransferase